MVMQCERNNDIHTQTRTREKRNYYFAGMSRTIIIYLRLIPIVIIRLMTTALMTFNFIIMAYCFIYFTPYIITYYTSLAYIVLFTHYFNYDNDLQ